MALLCLKLNFMQPLSIVTLGFVKAVMKKSMASVLIYMIIYRTIFDRFSLLLCFGMQFYSLSMFGKIKLRDAVILVRLMTVFCHYRLV